MNELTTAVDRLSREARDLRVELRKKNRSLWVAMISVIIAFGVLSGAAYTVTVSNSKAIDENNRKLCPMITILLPYPGDPAPTTERGRLVVTRAERIAREFHC